MYYNVEEYTANYNVVLMFSKSPQLNAPPEMIREERDLEEVRHRIGDTLCFHLAHGYQLGVQTLQRFGLDNDSAGRGGLSLPPVSTLPIPTFKEVMDRFTDEDLSLLPELQKPTILISPPCKTIQELLRALACHHEHGTQNGPLVIEHDSIEWETGTEYRGFITEAGCKVFPRNDSLVTPLFERIVAKNITRQPSECGMNSRLYLLLAMQSIVRGQMIDEKSFTILDGDSIVNSRYVPIGHCRNGQPTISWIPLDDDSSVRGRFRHVLKGSKG